jgi:hypothetical protein
MARRIAPTARAPETVGGERAGERPSASSVGIPALLLVGAAAAAVPLSYLVAGYTLEWKDTVLLYAPVRSAIVAALRDLRLPLWNPHEALGMPLFAQMLHGVLHPVSLAAAFLAPEASLDALAVVHVALAAMGSALLARRLGASAGAAAVAGLAYGGSGYVLGMSGNFMYLVGAATAPWTVAALHAAAAGARAGIPLAAVGTAAVLLAGDPQWAAVAAAMGLVLAATASGARGAARAAAGVAIGALLAGVQLAPTFALWSETARAHGLIAEGNGEWALSPWRLVELVAPGFFSGHPGASLVAPVYLWLGHPGERFVIPFAPSVFVGAVVLALAAIGARRHPWDRVLVAVAGVSLWLALGSALGADPIVRHLPLWGSFRYPEKLVGPFTLAAAVLAGLGADRVAGVAPRKLAWIAGAAAALAAILAAAAWAWHPAAADGIGREAAPLARSHLEVGLLHAAVALGLLGVAAAAARRWPGVARRLPLLLAALVLVESAAASPFALHAGAAAAHDPRPLELAVGEGARLEQPVPVERGDGPAGMDETDRLEVVESAMGYPAYNVAVGIDTFDGYTGLIPWRYKRLDLALGDAFGEARFAAMRHFAVTHAILPNEMEPQFAERARIAVTGARALAPTSPWFRAWELPHRPWAFFARSAVSVSSEASAVTELLREVALGGEQVEVEGATPSAPAPGRVLSVERADTFVRIEGESEGEALLVVNDAWWPGWEARIDGRPVEILCADTAVRAIRWPAGRHALEMRYAPPELRVGLAVSALGVLALAVACLLALRGRRGPRTP